MPRSFFNFVSFSKSLESAALGTGWIYYTELINVILLFFLKVQEKLKQWSDSFVEAFESQRFDEAVKCIQRMTYYERACEEIVKKLWGK